VSEIAFVRHGETERNRAGLLQGRSDASLTELGRAQAARVGALLARERPRRIATSPLPRAVETASIIAARCGSPPVQVDDRLVELDYGEWEGRPVADVSADDWRRWRDDASFAPPGGECLGDVAARIAAFCGDMARFDDTTVAVSHVSPIKAAVAWALGVPDSVAWRTRLSVASVTRVECAPTPVLLTFNEVPVVDA
jgi:broad specificity phosphatase PhoE